MNLLRATKLHLEMIRFSHTIFALPFALLSSILAWTSPTADGTRIEFRWLHVVGILVCMVGARSAAMAFNRLVDRKLDAENPRTQSRHLPAGTLSITSVVGFIVISALVFFAGTLLFLPNRAPLILATPVLLFLCGYSYAKRFTSLAHFWLGAALMLAPICAWIAIRGESIAQNPFDLAPPCLLGLAILSWVAGFDIIYACQDAAFDASAGLYSIPAKLGLAGALRLAAVCHFVTVLCFSLVPFMFPSLHLGVIFLVGVFAVACLLIYEHSIVKPNDLSRVNVAFLNVNSFVSLGMLLFGAIDSIL